MPVDWTEEPIGRQHDRARFDCGSDDLNVYLARYARQNHQTRSAVTYVAVPTDERTRVLGYYSLALTHVEFSDAPESMTRRLAAYPIPAVRLARIAVDLEFQGRGLGQALLFAAAVRALRVSQEVSGVLMVIDAKDARAVGWYRRFGAEPLASSPLTLAIRLETLEAAARLED